MKPLHFLPRACTLFLLFACALPACAITNDPSMIAFDDGTGNHRIYAFASGDNGTSVVNFWSNVFGPCQWSWVDLGLPDGAESIANPSAITYKGADGIQYVAVFAQSDTKRLVCDHWDGYRWIWDDLSESDILPTFRTRCAYLPRFSGYQFRSRFALFEV
jgi:hypothetical protein